MVNYPKKWKNPMERDPPFLGRMLPGDITVDNPDGVVGAFGLGPYSVSIRQGRMFNEGAGTPSGNEGAFSGTNKTVKVDGGSS